MAASNIVRKMEPNGTPSWLKHVTFRERLKYAVDAARRSRPLAIHPWLTYLFHLVPEPMARYVIPYCRFRLGSYRFIARRADWPVVDEVLCCGTYAILRRLLTGRERPVVVDLGANIGMFSLLAFFLNPSAEVHSVEASLETFRVLALNKSLNPALRWRIRQAAMWRENGWIRFETQRRFSAVSSVSAAGEELVPSMSLATLLSDHVRSRVDVLKVDIEGNEEALFCGDIEPLRKVEEVLIEIHPSLCDAYGVAAALKRAFDFCYELPSFDRENFLILASRRQLELPLWKL